MSLGLTQAITLLNTYRQLGDKLIEKLNQIINDPSVSQVAKDEAAKAIAEISALQASTSITSVARVLFDSLREAVVEGKTIISHHTGDIFGG